MFLYNVYRVGCEVSPLLLNHGSQCSVNRYIETSAKHIVQNLLISSYFCTFIV